MTRLDPYLVSVREAARLLGMSTWSAYLLCESGDLPSGRIDGRILIPVEAVRGIDITGRRWIGRRRVREGGAATNSRACWRAVLAEAT